MPDSNEATMHKAFRLAQMEMGNALKDSKNPHFKSDYADLKSVRDACFDAFHKHGFSVSQFPEYDAEHGFVTVETRLLHDCGQHISGRLSIPVGKRDAQAIGSAITYARRYALASMAGVAPADDDGNAASQLAPARSGPDPLALKREVFALVTEVRNHTGRLQDEICLDAGLAKGDATIEQLRAAKIYLSGELSQPGADS